MLLKVRPEVVCRFKYSFGIFSWAMIFVGVRPEYPSGIRAQSGPSSLKCVSESAACAAAASGSDSRNVRASKQRHISLAPRARKPNLPELDYESFKRVRRAPIFRRG